MHKEKYSLVTLEDFIKLHGSTEYTCLFDNIRVFLKNHNCVDETCVASDIVIINLCKNEHDMWHQIYNVQKCGLSWEEYYDSFSYNIKITKIGGIYFFKILMFGSMCTWYITHKKFLIRMMENNSFDEIKWEYVFSQAFENCPSKNEDYILDLVKAGKITWEMALPSLSEKTKVDNMTIISLDEMGF